jgi:hypothetical protein
MPNTAKHIPSVSLYELLDSLAEPLKEAAEERTTTSRRSAHLFSALSYFDNNETKQTEIIASLLKPAGRHEQGTIFLRHLLAKVWPSIRVEDRELQRATVYPNHFIPGDVPNSGGKRFIDVWVRVSSFCLAIESKAKGAEDQPGQVQAYLKYIKGCCPSGGKCKLLYLSPDGGGPCSESIPSAEWKKACEEGIAEAQPYAAFIRQWLTTCERDVEAGRVKFFIEDLLTFIDANDRRRNPMPTETLYPAIKEVLHGVSPTDPRSEERRMTLLSIWELSDQITLELLRIFQRNLCQHLKERGMTSSPCIDDDLLCKEWGFIKGPQTEFIVGEERLSAYAGVERCAPECHGISRPHLIIGINIDGIDDGKHPAELRTWRERAGTCGLGEGTGDKNWVWQEIPEGFEDLYSKETAIRLLDPNSAAEIVERMQDVWMRFEECVASEAAARRVGF